MVMRAWSNAVLDFEVTGSSLALTVLDQIFSFPGFTAYPGKSMPMVVAEWPGWIPATIEARGIHDRYQRRIPSGTAQGGSAYSPAAIPR
jgi:hypothetical protein